MPVIQPVTHLAPVRAVSKSDGHSTTYSPLQTPAQSTQHPQQNEIGDKAIEPAAPPTALQMQIKALLSEQSQMLSKASEDEPANPF